MIAAGGLRRIRVDRRGAALQCNADVHASHFEAGLEREDEPGCSATGAHFGTGVAEGTGGRIEPLHQAEQAVIAGLLILSEEAAKRHQQAHDGFLAHLALPADPVRGQSGQPVFIDQTRWWRPLLPGDVEVELLKYRRHNEVAPATEDAGALRAADCLAA